MTPENELDFMSEELAATADKNRTIKREAVVADFEARYGVKIQGKIEDVKFYDFIYQENPSKPDKWRWVELT